MSDPIHVIVVINEVCDEALYVGGVLHPIDDETVYARDIAEVAGDKVIQFSLVPIEGWPEDAWPKHFDKLMPFVVKKK